MQLDCPICQAPLRGFDRPKRHIAFCEQIDMGLLAEQLTPAVDKRPEGFDWASRLLP